MAYPELWRYQDTCTLSYYNGNTAVDSESVLFQCCSSSQNHTYAWLGFKLPGHRQILPGLYPGRPWCSYTTAYTLHYNISQIPNNTPTYATTCAYVNQHLMCMVYFIIIRPTFLSPFHYQSFIDYFFIFGDMFE